MEFMQARVRAFENVYRERLLVRLFAVGPDQDPDDYRAMLAEVLIPRPPLVRQTNRHHLLPTAKLEQWWAATTAEERNELMAEYNAAEAAAALRDAAAAEFRRLRAAGFTGSVVDTMERVARGEGTDEDERMVARRVARREAEEAADAAEDAAWTVTWPTAGTTVYQDELPEDDEERDAGTTVYQDDAGELGPLDYDDDGEVYDTLLLE